MDFKRADSVPFYLLKQPKSGTREDLRGGIDSTKEEDFNVGDCLRCPTCNQPLSMLKWLPPYRVEIETWGKHYGDVADVGDDLIVSERFVNVFRQHGLRGLDEIALVEIIKVIHRRGKLKEPRPRYFKATVLRSSTAIDQKASGYVWEDETKICPECLFGNYKRYDRLVIRQETWDGSDIFFPRGGTGPIVSERFRTTFEEEGLLGAIFIPALEYSYDYFPWETEAKKP